MPSPTQPQELEIDVNPGCVAPVFWDLLSNEDRYLLLWGGRDSTKSDFVALKLLLDCLRLPYFKCLLIRKIADTIAGSQVATLKAVAEREGLDQFFFFGVSPLVVRCLLNGNTFEARGLDNPKKIKSTKDPTCAWYEEANENTEAETDVVSTTLRTSRPGALIQEVFTFNPDHEKENYEQFWLYQKFFSQTGNPAGTSFTGHLTTAVEGQLVRRAYTVQHATIADNPWAPIERVAQYKAYGDLNPLTGRAYNAYKYRVWYLGLWANKQTGNEWYHTFAPERYVQATPYLPGVPIFQSWDANADPYSALLLAQLEHLPMNRVRVRIFAEYAISGPESGLRPTARQYVADHKARYSSSDLFYTGDASMRNRKPGAPTESQKKDVEAELLPVSHGASDRWLKHNPSVMGRRDWLNRYFAGDYPSIELWIDPACVELLADMQLTQKGIDGKLKELRTNAETGRTYQVRGHFTDVFEYLMATLFADLLTVFLRRGKVGAEQVA